MTHGITTIFISPWVETGEVVILDFLVFFGRIMKFYSIGSAAKETVTRIKSFLQIQLENELLQFSIFIQLILKLVLPYDNQIVSKIFEFAFSFFGHLVQFI